MWKTWRYKGLAGILAPSVVCTETEHPDFLKGSGSHQYVANKFIEDRIGQHHMKHKNLHFVTVMDGHGGPQAAEFLTREIPQIFLQKIAKEKSIVSALKSTFHEADQTWFNLVHPAYQLGFTAPIKVGACALAIVVDEKEITVASVGDCKCVLARDDGSSMDLNVERNINNEQEQERLRLLHPGEEDIVRCKRSWQDTVLMKTLYAGCYVKGRLQPTKSFGDFHLKDSRVILDHERQRPFLDPTTPKSFPYIDVDPDISVTKRSKSDRFLIAATDGLWDQFTSAEAVIIVEAALRAGLTPDRASEELVEAALRNAAKNRNLKIEDMKAIPPGSTRRGIHDDISVFAMTWWDSIGRASQELHQHMTVKQSGFLCCWSFDDYMVDGESHAFKASRAFAHAAGIATNEDLKALAARAAQHSSTAHQLGNIASKEL